MKKLLYILLLAAGLLQLSCDNNFSPKGAFQQDFVLNCVLRQDTSYQVATVTTSYNVNGFDPFSNKIDPSIQGAVIKLIYNDSVFVMRDSSQARQDTARYDTPVHFYYVNNLNINSAKNVQIIASMPDGRTLTATTRTPDIGGLFYFQGDETIPGQNPHYLVVSWTTNGNGDPGLYYLPRLMVQYYKRDKGPSVTYTKELPYDYVGAAGTPVYPHVSTQSYIVYNMSVLNRDLQGLVGPGENKQDYFIAKIYADIFIFDKNLAAYISSTQTYMDGFSIRTEAPDFTNIQGGYGIFGSFIRRSQTFTIAGNYIRSLGLLPGF